MRDLDVFLEQVAEKGEKRRQKQQHIAGNSSAPLTAVFRLALGNNCDELTEARLLREIMTIESRTGKA